MPLKSSLRHQLSYKQYLRICIHFHTMRVATNLDFRIILGTKQYLIGALLCPNNTSIKPTLVTPSIRRCPSFFNELVKLGPVTILSRRLYAHLATMVWWIGWHYPVYKHRIRKSDLGSSTLLLGDGDLPLILNPPGMGSEPLDSAVTGVRTPSW